MAILSTLSSTIKPPLTRQQSDVHREYVRRAAAYYRNRFCPCPYRYPLRLPKNIHVEYRDGNVVVEITYPEGGIPHVY